MRISLLLILGLIAGCNNSALSSSSDLAGADLTGADLTGVLLDLTPSPNDLSAGAQPDLTAGTAGIQCGSAQCTPPSNICCSADHGFSGTCVMSTGQCTTGIAYSCASTADCDGLANGVCCLRSGVAQCVPSIDCASSGEMLCADRSECFNGQECCGFSGLGGGFTRCSNLCPVSRRRYKTDIQYLDEAEQRRLHDELLRYPLATWRYKRDGAAAKSRLGFIIEDVTPSQAVAPDGETVDLYGYTTMAVAALQQQAREIAALRQEIAALRRQVARPRKGR